MIMMPGRSVSSPCKLVSDKLQMLYLSGFEGEKKGIACSNRVWSERWR